MQNPNKAAVGRFYSTRPVRSCFSLLSAKHIYTYLEALWTIRHLPNVKYDYQNGFVGVRSSALRGHMDFVINYHDKVQTEFPTVRTRQFQLYLLRYWHALLSSSSKPHKISSWTLRSSIDSWYGWLQRVPVTETSSPCIGPRTTSEPDLAVIVVLN